MRFRTLILAALLVAGFVYITTKPNGFLRGNSGPDGATWSGPQVALSAGLTSDEQNNIDVYKASRDAVVYITSTVIQRSLFFGYEQGRALGSGFIINQEGQIITNHHVISGSSDVEVTLPDQSTYKATVLVKDPQDDLALIKIEPKKKLPHLALGDSDRLQVGQKVLAIGQPLGLQGTLTVGVVSTVGRDIEGENNQRLEGMIQTDAAINSGNSGGPLLDSQANVVGINTAIYGPNGNIGIGFAMPINRVKNMLEDYRAGKRFGKPYFGATVVYIAGDLAEALHLPSSGGLLIQEIHRGSPSDEAGLRQYHDVVRVGNQRLGVGGDFITQIDGKAVADVDSLVRAMTRKRPGDDLDLTIFRGGKSLHVKVKLGESPESPI
jgi:S1-C subfamily serine protease